MTELLCNILEIKYIGEKKYFVIYSIAEEQEYFIPLNQLLIHNVKVGQRHFFKKEENIKSKHFFLNYKRPEISENIDKIKNDYKIGQVYDFNILAFENKLYNSGETHTIISVKDVHNNILPVLALKWQKKEIWDYETIKCEIERITDNGIPRLLNKDFRHPFYNINDEYEFAVIGEKIKETKNGCYNIFQLKGADDCIHEVNMLPGQKYNSICFDKIRCKVTNITYRLNLCQVNIKDPFFVSFDEIVPNKELENKYFINIFKENDKTKQDVSQLIEQYNSKSAFWVFTFTNKVLAKSFRESIERQDYKRAKEINKLIITFESWIISKGIISSFPDEEIKASTKTKAQSTLDSAKILDSVLTKLAINQFEFLRDDEFFQNQNNLLERFYHISRFTNIELIEENLFVVRLIEVMDKFNHLLSNSDSHFLVKLLKYISGAKKVFISEQEKQNFSLSSVYNHSVNFSNNETKYSIWTYCEILIAQKLSMPEHFNIQCGQLLKLFTKSTNDIDKKECLLFYAYRYFEKYQNHELQFPFTFNSKLEINYQILKFNNDNPFTDWDELETLFQQNSSLTVRLKKKNKTGYEVDFKNIKGFLPHHYIKDSFLKNYPFEESDFSINTKCISLSKAFRFFIVEQILSSDRSNNFTNNIQFKEGCVYDAIIKNVVEFGLFLSTNAGEGLLHINHIFDKSWNTSNLNKYFRKGQNIKVVLMELSFEKKASFNFLQIKEIFPLYYYNYIEEILSVDAKDFFEPRRDLEQTKYFDIAQNEKAFCIEQYAVLQSDILSKIQNFQIAKQFYTNAQNARSYLINIYISYFEVLLKISAALRIGNIGKINEIKIDVSELKLKISKKTIDIFPDSDRLVFFLDIISMFNEKSDSIFESLFDYIKQYSNETTQKDLRTIAKITLANNLLISESKEDSDFIFKNLRLIYNYLSNGILSLEESIDDKNARELKEDILYWQEKIKEDESESLEFKSSFFTPILNDNALRKIDLLNKSEIKSEKIVLEINRTCGALSRKILIHSSLKSLVAFANSSGGTLLIGVDNNKNIIGLEHEYLSTIPKLSYPSRDGFGLYFDDMVKNYIGDSFSSLMSRRFLKFPNGDVLIIKVQPSINEVFLLKNDEGKDCEQLYIRNLSSSKELSGSELVKFIKNRLQGQLPKSFV